MIWTLLLVVFVMLFSILFLLVYCVSLSIVRSVPVPVSHEVVKVGELSLGELFAASESAGCSGSRFVGSVRRARRVRLGVGVVVRGRSGRRVGGAARSARLRRVVGRAWFSQRLVVRSVGQFVAQFAREVGLQRVA